MQNYMNALHFLNNILSKVVIFFLCFQIKIESEENIIQFV